MRALLVGDIVGGVGMRALLARLPELREEHRPDVVVVNCENAAGGAGTSPRQATELLEAGVDVLTGGNHSLQKPEINPMLEAEPRMLRPANIAAKAPGRGLTTVETAAGPVSVMNTDPMMFTTLTGPAAVSTVVTPRPGAFAAMFAGRSIRGSASSIGRISGFWRVWLPPVSTSTPASSSSVAWRGEVPAPPAAFSQLTTTTSGRCSSRSSGRRASSARMPTPPTTSPTSRARIRGSAQPPCAPATGPRGCRRPP